MPAISLPTAFGSVAKPNVNTTAIITATVIGADEIADEDDASQLRSTPPSVTPGRLSSSASGVSTNDAGQQVVAQQIEHDEADREQQRAHQRLARRLVDRDGERRGQRQDGARHERPDEGVLGGHEHLRFAGIDRFPHEICRHHI